MTVSISRKIVSVSVRKPEANPSVPSVAEVELAEPGLVDIDPLLVRIPRRPEGTLDAVSEKITYSTWQGKKTVYVLVSFVPVDGILDGRSVTIERPIEFFFPVGQLGSESQWITATMRSLSLAARGGYATQALADLRKVTWDKGVVTCGRNEWGKPISHDSEVAAIAWALQRILYRRGFLDAQGNQVPVTALAKRYMDRNKGVTAEQPGFTPEQLPLGDDLISRGSAVNDDSVGAAKVQSVGTCPDCESHLILMDGCPSCTTCGYSNCS